MKKNRTSIATKNISTNDELLMKKTKTSTYTKNISKDDETLMKKNKDSTNTNNISNDDEILIKSKTTKSISNDDEILIIIHNELCEKIELHITSRNPLSSIFLDRQVMNMKKGGSCSFTATLENEIEILSAFGSFTLLKSNGNVKLEPSSSFDQVIQVNTKNKRIPTYILLADIINPSEKLINYPNFFDMLDERSDSLKFIEIMKCSIEDLPDQFTLFLLPDKCMNDELLKRFEDEEFFKQFLIKTPIFISKTKKYDNVELTSINDKKIKLSYNNIFKSNIITLDNDEFTFAFKNDSKINTINRWQVTYVLENL
jgi:hypothetical protein